VSHDTENELSQVKTENKNMALFTQIGDIALFTPIPNRDQSEIINKEKHGRKQVK
jgi:hypothetical protein